MESSIWTNISYHVNHSTKQLVNTCSCIIMFIICEFQTNFKIHFDLNSHEYYQIQIDINIGTSINCHHRSLFFVLQTDYGKALGIK